MEQIILKQIYILKLPGSSRWQYTVDGRRYLIDSRQ